MMELSSNSLATLIELRMPPSRSGIGKSTPTTAPSAWDLAIRHLAQGDSMAAYKELVSLANAGHIAAARIAMLMTTRGPRLFGQRFAASPSERERWHRISDCHGLDEADGQRASAS
jgi:hypothetical protein